MPKVEVLEDPSASHIPSPSVEVADRQFVRFTRLQRVLHACMIVSFITLAMTGLTLKFSYTRWAAIVSHLFGGFETAGYIHRSAAVVMFSVFITHLVDLYRMKRKEYGTWRALVLGPGSMVPNRKDLIELIGTLKWFVGLGERPAYGRWTYWEKFDYFAVFWGIAIIGSTGLTLWFPVFFTRFLPGSFLNVATIVHSDEALARHRLYLYRTFFQYPLAPRKVSHGHHRVFTGRMPSKN